MLALTRPPAPSFGEGCLVTYLERRPVDPDEAARQHAGYRSALERAGCRVVELPPRPDLPDAVFVEDVAVALPGLLVLTRPGAPSRRAEVEAVVGALPAGLPVARIEAPATLEGGDVVRLGRRLLVGLSGRTNAAGVRALAALVEPLGYAVESVAVEGALHLESVCTAVDDRTVLVDPRRVEVGALSPARVVEAHPDEPGGASVLLLPGRDGRGVLVMSASWPRTAARLRDAGRRVVVVPLGEFEKAEGGPTCLSLRVPAA